jgi:hypothetical protein
MAPRRMQQRPMQQPRQGERVFRVQDQGGQQAPPQRAPRNAPVLPEDDWEGESSIIRFLRER